MKRSCCPVLLGLGLLIAVSPIQPQTQAAVPVLPADAAYPIGSGLDQGFTIRVVQAPEATPVANSFVRAVHQLNGTLTYADGTLVPNEALPGPNPDGSYNTDTVNFEKDGAPVEGFIASLFPGIPGSGGHTKYFAVEAVGFVEVTAGRHTFGMIVNADRTDANDDDSYAVFCSANPRDFFGTKIGEYERFAQPF